MNQPNWPAHLTSRRHYSPWGAPTPHPAPTRPRNPLPLSIQIWIGAECPTSALPSQPALASLAHPTSPRSTAATTFPHYRASPCDTEPLLPPGPPLAPLQSLPDPISLLAMVAAGERRLLVALLLLALMVSAHCLDGGGHHGPRLKWQPIPRNSKASPPDPRPSMVQALRRCNLCPPLSGPSPLDPGSIVRPWRGHSAAAAGPFPKLHHRLDLGSISQPLLLFIDFILSF
ncbi:hypothetical protein ZWY2020_015418 [Hordeum vulgare]|nr:hypothetical protein ZWY2020_015418 [Hordeum vulgare]